MQFFHAAPSSPTEVKGNPISSTSINVTWSNPENGNGIIKYYEVTYHSLGDTSDRSTIRVHSPNRSLLLINLKKFTFYLIVVRAFTIEFSDNSSSIIVRTLEDGKTKKMIGLYF